jgi:hypothetical protein
VPAAAQIAARLRRQCVVSSASDPATYSPLAASSGIWPEQKSRPPWLIAWL